MLDMRKRPAATVAAIGLLVPATAMLHHRPGRSQLSRSRMYLMELGARHLIVRCCAAIRRLDLPTTRGRVPMDSPFSQIRASERS